MPGLIKNACPGVHRPMVAADGLLARIRVPGGRLSLDQWQGVTRAAATHGSGVVEATSRANLQLRGVGETAVPALTDDLVELGLIHPNGDIDQRRNVVGAPATGLDATEVVDVGGLVAELERRLTAVTGAIHPKAGVLVDAGGQVSLRGRRADVAIGAVRRRDTGAVVFEVRLDGSLPAITRPAELVPVVGFDDVARWAVAALTSAGGERVTGADPPAADVEWLAGDLLDRSPADTGAPLGARSQRDGRWLLGAAPVLGRLDPATATAIADRARRHGATELRLTPWRGVLIGDLPTVDLLDELGHLGLVIDDHDPAGGVIACAGRSGCPSGTTDTIADGRATVTLRRGRPGGATSPTIHFSGCSKRCASHAPHDLTFVAADDGTYDVFDAADREIARSVTPERARELASQ